MRNTEKLPDTYLLRTTFSSVFSDKLTIVWSFDNLILLDQREGEEQEILKLREAMRYLVTTILQIVFKSETTLRSHPAKQDGVVYRIPCECGKVYIGETGRSIHERIKERDRDIRLACTQTSAVSEHAHETGHYPLWNDVKFIDRDSHWYTRRVKEAIHIRLHPNNKRETFCEPMLSNPTPSMCDDQISQPRLDKDYQIPYSQERQRGQMQGVCPGGGGGGGGGVKASIWRAH